MNRTFAGAATSRMNETGFYLEDKRIWGPHGYTETWITNGRIYSTAGDTGYRVLNDRIYDGLGFTGFEVRDGRILGPTESLPWVHDPAGG